MAACARYAAAHGGMCVTAVPAGCNTTCENVSGRCNFVGAVGECSVYSTDTATTCHCWDASGRHYVTDGTCGLNCWNVDTRSGC
jgi:hypothetical protein